MIGIATLYLCEIQGNLMALNLAVRKATKRKLRAPVIYKYR